jgi:hypothetical protein
MEYDNVIRDIMMKKITLAALLLTTGFSAYAETETCKQYFAEVDSFIELASKQEGQRHRPICSKHSMQKVKNRWRPSRRNNRMQDVSKAWKPCSN